MLYWECEWREETSCAEVKEERIANTELMAASTIDVTEVVDV